MTLKHRDFDFRQYRETLYYLNSELYGMRTKQPLRLNLFFLALQLINPYSLLKNDVRHYMDGSAESFQFN